jgi:hypothetical protein
MATFSVAMFNIAMFEGNRLCFEMAMAMSCRQQENKRTETRVLPK